MQNSAEKGATSLFFALIHLLFHFFVFKLLALDQVALSVRPISLLVIHSLIEMTVEFPELQLEEALVVFVFVEEGDVFDGLDDRTLDRILGHEQVGTLVHICPLQFRVCHLLLY